MLRLGYKASAEQFAPRQLLDFSVLAEEVGFESVFISDHFQPWKHVDGHAPCRRHVVDPIAVPGADFKHVRLRRYPGREMAGDRLPHE